MNVGIINQAKLFQYFDVRIILISLDSKNESIFQVNNTNVVVQRFNYSVFDNYNFVLKSLKSLIDEKLGIVVTNDGLELDCLKYLGTEQIVFHIVHDLYNLKLSLNNIDVIDYFICHTKEMSTILLTDRILKSRVYFLPFGVDIPNRNKPKNKGVLKIVSLSRLVESKGVLRLYDIENRLVELGIHVDWWILGDGPLKEDLLVQWSNKNNVFFGQPTDDELGAILAESDLFISLSEFEGYGISLLEALSNGLVPIITKLPIGIHSILSDSHGLILEDINIQKIVSFINSVNDNNIELLNYQSMCRSFVEENYSSRNTGLGYFELFSLRTEKKTKGSRYFELSNFGLFDRWFIPNLLSKYLKKLLKQFFIYIFYAICYTSSLSDLNYG